MSAGEDEFTAFAELGPPELEALRTGTPPTRSLAGSFLVTFSGGALGLALSLFTGIVTARLLGPAGRGQFTAVSSWALTMSWLGSLGFGDAMTFYQSKQPEDGPQILSTTLLSIVVLGALSIIFSELLLPLGFRAQQAHTLHLAQVFMLSLPAFIGLSAMWGLLAGHQRFALLSLARVAQPLLFAAGLGVLWGAGRFTVTNTLALLAASYLPALVLIAWYLQRSLGLGMPSLRLTRQGLKYGLRLQGQTLGALGNARLDVTLLPAFVAARQLGFYGIAVSVASMVVVLFGTLTQVVFPVASRTGGEAGAAIVERTLRMVLICSALVAMVLGIAAPRLIRIVYGASFLHAVRPLRTLLPGIVFWAATSIAGAGLQAFNRPGRASLAQLIGFAVTAVGLAITLPSMGIEGAALTSSLSYTVTFGASLAFLMRCPDFSLRRTFAVASLRDDLWWLRDRLRALLPV